MTPKKAAAPKPQSRRFCFNREDVQKVAKGALVAGLGGLAAYLTTLTAAQDLTSTDGIILAATFSILTNAIHKYIDGGAK